MHVVMTIDASSSRECRYRYASHLEFELAQRTHTGGAQPTFYVRVLYDRRPLWLRPADGALGGGWLRYDRFKARC